MKQNQTMRPGCRARKRNGILAAGKKVFLVHGFVAARVDEIALKANVSERNDYENFGNKQTLFEAVILELCEQSDPPAFLTTDTDKDIKAVLTQFAEWFLVRIYSNEQINLLRTLINDSRRFPEIGDMMLSGPVKRTQNAVATYLTAQVRKRRLSLGDPKMVASLFIAMIKADVHMMLLLGQSNSNLLRQIRRNAAATVSLFLAGAQPVKERSWIGI